MMKTGILIAVSLTALLAQVEAEVVLTLNNYNAVANETNTITLKDLETDPPTVVGVGVDVASGTFSGASGDFSFTAAGVNDWNYLTADGHSDLKEYVSERNSVGIGANTNGWGVFGGSNNDRLDADGEALVITFTTNSLTGSLICKGLGFNRIGTHDRYNYMLIDVDDGTGTIDAQGAGQDSASLTVDFEIGDGDVLIVGREASNFQLQNLTFDVVAVPEPSAYALIGGLLALGSVMLRRRR